MIVNIVGIGIFDSKDYPVVLTLDNNDKRTLETFFATSPYKTKFLTLPQNHNLTDEQIGELLNE